LITVFIKTVHQGRVRLNINMQNINMTFW